jgi:hypothetical protein
MNIHFVKASVLLLILAAVSLFSTLQAQPPGTKYGKVTDLELKMTDYDKEPGAAAVVLFDVGSTRFDYIPNSGFKIVFERQTRIKILKKEGYEFADVRVPFYKTPRGKQEVSSIKATTYNLENGKPVETKMEKSATFEEKLDKYWHLKKFTLPNVREGSVIEYTYELSSDFLSTLPDWEFQWEIPVAWSQYKTATPEYFRYVQVSEVHDAFETHETDRVSRTISILYTVDVSNDPTIVKKQSRTETVNYYDHTSLWIQQDMPALKEESYVASRHDLIPRVEFQLASVNFPGELPDRYLPTWGQLVQELNEEEDFGKLLSKGNAVRESLGSVLTDAPAEKDKINAIHRFVKTNFQWNQWYSYLASQTIGNLLKTRQGNSADLNLLLVLLLREAGINAHPVILSTRSHGRVNTAYPLLSKFNHALAYVTTGGKGFPIDAIDPQLPVDMICFEDLNGEGLLIKPDGYDWIALGENIKENSYHSVNATIHEGALKGTINMAHRGYGAVQMRNVLQKSNTADAAKTYFKAYFSEVDLQEPKFENPEDANAPLKGVFSFTSPSYVEDGGDFIYVNPMLGFGLKESPFKKPERTYPVDFAHPADDVYQFNFAVPAGYTVAEVPKPLRLVNEDGTLRCDYNVESKPTEVKISYRFSRKRILFKPDEYSTLKNFYEQIATQCSGQIVLKKAG